MLVFNQNVDWLVYDRGFKPGTFFNRDNIQRTNAFIDLCHDALYVMHGFKNSYDKEHIYEPKKFTDLSSFLHYILNTFPECKDFIGDSAIDILKWWSEWKSEDNKLVIEAKERCFYPWHQITDSWRPMMYKLWICEDSQWAMKNKTAQDKQSEVK